jgi:hypothetical protein
VAVAGIGCGLDLAGEEVGGLDGGEGGRNDDAGALDDRTVATDTDSQAVAPDSREEPGTDSPAEAPPPDAPPPDAPPPDAPPPDAPHDAPPPDALPPPSIGFVQVAAATPQTDSVNVSVTYAMAQTAGDFDIVVVGWNDTVVQVTSVGDSSGNVYTRAVGPTTESTDLSQSIYYSPNIRAAAAGGNVVTVTFSSAAQYADVRIVEYRGIAAANPLDQTSQGNGVSAAASAPAVTTTSSNELIFAAGTTTGTFDPVAAPFVQRIITTPDGDTVEDQIATSAGSYGVTAQQSGVWVMQLATFRSAP